ncbi:MAG: ATP-binding protein [Acidobacteriota bacterium]
MTEPSAARKARGLRRFGRLGLRGELLVLPPTALLLLLVLSSFTLLSYRSGLDLLAEERRDRAARLAAAAAAELASAGGAVSARELSRLAPQALGVALLDRRGVARVRTGTLSEDSPALPAGAQEIVGARGYGPNGRLPYSVVGIAPLGPAANRRFVRVDLEAAELGAQLRSSRVLAWVVLPANAAVLLLVLFFLRHSLSPFEKLLERARSLRDEGGGEVAGDDEVQFLLATFERALASLGAAHAGPSPGGGEEELEAISRTLTRSLDSGVLLLDAQGRVIALNEVGAELLDIEPPPSGTALRDALAERSALAEVLGEAAATGRGLRRKELPLATGDGPRTIGITLHPLRRDDGAVRGHLALFADLTESQRRARENHLTDSLERLGELAGGVAHELRNSLATLKGYLTLIDRAPEDESIRDYLTEIRREADHLQRVLEDFLAFARPGSVRLEEIALSELVRRAVADPALGGAVRWVGGEESRGPTIEGDRQLLERAVRNLLHNAVEAEREAGRLPAPEAWVEDAEGGASVLVADRGAGISPEMRERLFHPFATGRPGGVGLGLALSHRIVTLHGGSLVLEDQSGGGTRARIHLPYDASVTIRNDLD